MMNKSASTPEPLPTGDGQIILELIIQDLKDRSEMGEKKYGTKLRAFNGRDAQIDGYQEQLDNLVYSKQEQYEKQWELEQLRHTYDIVKSVRAFFPTMSPASMVEIEGTLKNVL